MWNVTDPSFEVSIYLIENEIEICYPGTSYKKFVHLELFIQEFNLLTTILSLIIKVVAPSLTWHLYLSIQLSTSRTFQ